MSENSFPLPIYRFCPFFEPPHPVLIAFGRFLRGFFPAQTLLSLCTCPIATTELVGHFCSAQNYTECARMVPGAAHGAFLCTLPMEQDRPCRHRALHAPTRPGCCRSTRSSQHVSVALTAAEPFGRRNALVLNDQGSTVCSPLFRKR